MLLGITKTVRQELTLKRYKANYFEYVRTPLGIITFQLKRKNLLIKNVLTLTLPTLSVQRTYIINDYN